jgi:hypothetical protein
MYKCSYLVPYSIPLLERTQNTLTDIPYNPIIHIPPIRLLTTPAAPTHLLTTRPLRGPPSAALKRIENVHDGFLQHVQKQGHVDKVQNVYEHVPEVIRDLGVHGLVVCCAEHGNEVLLFEEADLFSGCY